MEFLKCFIIIILTLYLLSMIIFAARSGKAFKFLFLNAFLGLLVLLILYFTKSFTDINLAINKITVALSGFFGIIGVIFILCLNLMI